MLLFFYSSHETKEAEAQPVSYCPGNPQAAGALHHGAAVPGISGLPGNDGRPGLVHRIDKDTSGLLLISKNEITMTKLAKQFFDKTTERVYKALVWGNFQENEGTIKGNIGRSLKDRMQMDVFPNGEQGKHAVTHYKVIENFIMKVV